jgi:hypothetical protein
MKLTWYYNPELPQDIRPVLRSLSDPELLSIILGSYLERSVCQAADTLISAEITAIESKPVNETEQD